MQELNYYSQKKHHKVALNSYFHGALLSFILRGRWMLESDWLTNVLRCSAIFRETYGERSSRQLSWPHYMTISLWKMISVISKVLQLKQYGFGTTCMCMIRFLCELCSFYTEKQDVHHSSQPKTYNTEGIRYICVRKIQNCNDYLQKNPPMWIWNLVH